MSSRVLTGTRGAQAEPIHWLLAFGEPVNACPPAEEPASAEPPEAAAVVRELEGARQRIQVLERRIQELEAELPRRTEKGRQEGRLEGEKTGAAAAAAALQPMMDRLAATLGDLASHRARFRRDSEPELVKLALAVARKILRRELTVDPHSLLGILRAALETMNQAEILSIRVAPEDAASLSGRLENLGLPDKMEVIADRTLERGALLLETKRGQIDASVATQLAEIENGFADRISPHNSR